VFLCHSHHDELLVRGVITLLEEAGCRVYVDWADGSMPETPTRETAARIKQKIVDLNYFISLLLDSWGVAEGQETNNSTKECNKALPRLRAL